MHRMISIFVALFLGGLAPGCGTFHNRGGLTDTLHDYLVFPADSKEHRALRSYLMLATLARIGEQSAASGASRDGLASEIGRGVTLASEVFECAYRKIELPCAFFDDRVAELDILLFHLSLRILSPPSDRDVMLALLQTFRGYTAFDDVLGAGISVLKATGSSAKAIAGAADILQALLGFSAAQYERGHRIGALWRDSLDLDIQIIVDSACREPALWTSAGYRPDMIDRISSSCGRAKKLRRNEGELRLWLEFARGMSAEARGQLRPDAAHFFQISELIWRTCDSLGKTGLKRAECRMYAAKEDGADALQLYGNGRARLILGQSVAKFMRLDGLKAAEDRALQLRKISVDALVEPTQR